MKGQAYRRSIAARGSSVAFNNFLAGLWFKAYSGAHGFHEAVRLRDSGEPIPGSKR